MLRDQEKSVQRIRQTAKAAGEQLNRIAEWAPNFKFSDGNTLWDGSDIPDQSYSFQDAILESKRVIDAVHGMPPSRIGLSSAASTSALLTAVVGCRNSIKSLYDAIVAVANLKPTGRLINYIANDAAGNQTADVGQLASAAIDSIEAIKAALPAFVTYPKSDPKIGVMEIAATASVRKELIEQRDAAVEISNEISEARSRSLEAHKEVEQLKGVVEAQKGEINEKLDQSIEAAESARKEIQGIVEELRESTDTAKGHRTEIESLRDSAQEISANLVAFDGTLKSIRDEIEEIRTSASVRYEDQNKYVLHVEELVKKAQDMLGVATIAGLAQAFDAERKDLDSRMRGAMLGFGLGIAMILVVTALLAIYVFRIELGQEFFGISNTETAVTVSGLLARSIILLGPVWLTLFSARRYRNLFDLRQQYSHKYNMAFSVNGFQNQAPDYKQQIAYWVFQTVGANPVSGSDSKGGMDEHPMDGIKDLLNSIVSRLPMPTKPD